MKKLTNLIKNTDPKKIIGLGVATAVGAAYGLKAVAKKRKQDLANSDVKKKASEAVSTTLAAGAKVVGGIREDISTVVGSAKEKNCAARCAHCEVKDTFKPCCKDGEACKVKNSEEEVAAPAEPVEADEVVAAQAEADALAEKLKNDVLKAEKRAASAEAKKKATTPRAAKANAKPVSATDDAEPDFGVGKIELADIADTTDIAGTEEETETVEKSEEK